MITCLGLSAALDVTYLVDRVEVSTIHRPREVIALPGGKSLNVARAVRLLGGDVRAIAPLGGHTGARVRAGLDGLDVHVIDLAAETRQCLTVFDDAGGATEFYEPAPALDAAAWPALEEALRGVEAGWLAFSGSVPHGDAGRIADLLARAADRGVRVAVDTHGAALAAVLGRFTPDLVKVNRDEATALVGSGSAEELASVLQQRTGGVAVVTDGAAGAVGANSDGAWRVEPPLRGRYAVGSGDSFLAGLLVALDEGATLPDALHLATAAGAANTLMPGAARFDPADTR